MSRGIRKNESHLQGHRRWLRRFVNHYQEIVPLVCESHHSCSANVLCGYMTFTMEALSNRRLMARSGILLGRQFEGQSVEDGAYMPHWWCVDRHGLIVDFSPFVQQGSGFEFEYVTKSKSPKLFDQLSQLIIQPMNYSIDEWFADFEVTRRSIEFASSVEAHVIACRELIETNSIWSYQNPSGLV